MARIDVTADQIHIRLSTWEKLVGFMGDRTIPRTAVTDVALEPEPLRATRGLRAPGLGVPGVVKVGTWRGERRRMYVSIRRSVPAVRIETTGLDRDAFLVSVPDAKAVVDSLTS